MLIADSITKIYHSSGKVALENFSIKVPQSSIYGLLGPNGAGKTTFIRIVNQIIKQDSGDIFIGGEKLHPDHIKKIGYMPEERGLYKNMLVGDQLLYFGRLKGMKKSDILSEAKSWFEAFEIDQWWKKKLVELSKGMAQKIQFIVTVIHRPKLLILDEPFSGFDPVNASLVKDQIIRLKQEGTTIILSTHRMESVEEMCDSVVLINQSKKILDGNIFEIKEKFKEYKSKVLLSDINEEAYLRFKGNREVERESFDNGILSFELKNNDSQNELLKELLKIGKIRSFDEKIPNMNEIFIKAVK